MDALIPRERREVAPGAVHLPDWLSPARQRELVVACREWSRGPSGLRAARLPGGGVMSVRSVGLGWHWYPYRYSRTIDDGDGSPVPPFPAWLGDLAGAAVSDAYRGTAYGGEALGFRPDVALVNFYDADARMGMHQDREERGSAPVVSLSLGDSCVFRFGNTTDRGRPWTDVELCSGDLFVFGGPARFAFHGVPRTYPGTADPELGMSGGRLNITVRESGLPTGRGEPAGPVVVR